LNTLLLLAAAAAVVEAAAALVDTEHRHLFLFLLRLHIQSQLVPGALLEAVIQEEQTGRTQCSVQ